MKIACYDIIMTDGRSAVYLQLYTSTSPLVEDHRAVLLQDTILHQVSEVVVFRVSYGKGKR